MAQEAKLSAIPPFETVEPSEGFVKVKAGSPAQLASLRKVIKMLRPNSGPQSLPIVDYGAAVLRDFDSLGVRVHVDTREIGGGRGRVGDRVRRARAAEAEGEACLEGSVCLNFALHVEDEKSETCTPVQEG